MPPSLPAPGEPAFRTSRLPPAAGLRAFLAACEPHSLGADLAALRLEPMPSAGDLLRSLFAPGVR